MRSRAFLKIVLVVVGAPIVLMGVLVLHVVSFFDGDAVFPIDCAVVFGAAVGPQSSPGPGITRRTMTAVELYKQGKIQRLFLSGGKGGELQRSEADVMKGVAMLAGVDPGAIALESQSTSTWENLENVRPLTGLCTSVVGISDAYHLARIRYLASKQGWDDLTVYPAQGSVPLGFQAQSVLREVLGILYYAVRDYAPVDRLVAPG